jgi:hypothetical protein
MSAQQLPPRNNPKFELPITLGDFMRLAMSAYNDAGIACTAPPGTPNAKTFATPQDFVDSLVVFTTQRIRALPLTPTTRGTP